MRYVLLVFLGACSYGVLSTFVKLAYHSGFVVNEVSGSQMLLGAVMSWIPALLLSRKKATRKQWLLLLGVGLTVGATGIFYYAALQYVPASIGIVLLFQFTWIGVLIEAVTERKPPEADKILALVLLMAGTILAGGILGSEWQHVTLLGIVLGFLAAISYALFILFSGKTAVTVDPWKRSAIMATGSVMLTFVVFPPEFLINGALFEGLLMYGFPLALFGVLIPTILFNVGVPKVGGGLATILSAAELPTAVFMSAFVLQEQVSGLQWVGVGIILLGISVPEIYRTRTSRRVVKIEPRT
ncbi:DMT family transporter [Brevibacillus humidisoli]|uniref:EamA family transporter n=1 Tax=Brevibacillus humidisoli TaxID=2895522 RepID=UPI001E5C9985|nr:DMT family transporter [Brevibacillus humidisoli]UFJ43257.1 DMT family transporter [Brevibacillus humidisoli]